jgi:hypothetical protein
VIILGTQYCGGNLAQRSFGSINRGRPCKAGAKKINSGHLVLEAGHIQISSEPLVLEAGHAQINSEPLVMATMVVFRSSVGSTFLLCAALGTSNFGG